MTFSNPVETKSALCPMVHTAIARVERYFQHPLSQPLDESLNNLKVFLLKFTSLKVYWIFFSLGLQCWLQSDIEIPKL